VFVADGSRGRPVSRAKLRTDRCGQRRGWQPTRASADDRGRVVYVRRESDDVLPRQTRRALLRRATSPRRIREVLRYVGVLAAYFCSLK